MDPKKKQHFFVPQKCPLCGVQQDMLSCVPLGGDKARTVAHVHCQECLTNILTFASQSDSGILTVGIVTDLFPQEAQFFFGAERVSSEDVLAMYAYLKHGDMQELFTSL